MGPNATAGIFHKLSGQSRQLLSRDIETGTQRSSALPHAGSPDAFLYNPPLLSSISYAAPRQTLYRCSSAHEERSMEPGARLHFFFLGGGLSSGSRIVASWKVDLTGALVWHLLYMCGVGRGFLRQQGDDFMILHPCGSLHSGPRHMLGHRPPLNRDAKPNLQN